MALLQRHRKWKYELLERRVADCSDDCIEPRACERSVSGAENGAELPENRVERSGAVSGRGRKTVKRSGARSGRSRSGNGAWSGLNWPLTARSNVIFY